VREEGYYWARYKDSNSLPEILLLSRGRWWRAGFEAEEAYNDVFVLSERLLPPDWDEGPPIKSET
jgi:hypothetical protein